MASDLTELGVGTANTYVAAVVPASLQQPLRSALDDAKQAVQQAKRRGGHAEVKRVMEDMFLGIVKDANMNQEMAVMVAAKAAKLMAIRDDMVLPTSPPSAIAAKRQANKDTYGVEHFTALLNWLSEKTQGGAWVDVWPLGGSAAGMHYSLCCHACALQPCLLGEC